MEWFRVTCAAGVVVLGVVAGAGVAAPASGVSVDLARPDSGVVVTTPAGSSTLVTGPDLRRPAPPPGAIVSAFVANQFTYCSLICPHIVDGVIQVPIALVQAPGIYTAARSCGETFERSTGVAARSVTRPANSAMTGIIDNDLHLVLPRAQNALEVAVVGALDVADSAQSGATPALGARSVDTMRADIVDALHAPIVADPPDIAVPHTPAQAGALDTIDRGSAILFQAPEMLMVGGTQAADVAARTLTTTGSTATARAAGMTQFSTVLRQAIGVVEQTNARQHRVVPR